MISIKKISLCTSRSLIVYFPACFFVPEIINFFSFASSFGAFNLVQGNLRAGPNCSNMCFIPVCPPAR